MSLDGIGDYYNIADLILERNMNNKRENKVAIYYKDKEISYRELEVLVNKVGNGLAKLGVQMEERVALLLHDSPEFVASFLGCIKIGAVAVPLNTRSHGLDAEYFLNYCRAKVIIANSDLWEEIKHLRDRFVFLKHVVLVENEDDNAVKEGCVHYRLWIDLESPELKAVHTTRDDQALWLFTSGTTGKPKAVMHLHHDIEFCANNFAANVLQLTEKDITFSASKLFFAYGLGNGLYFPLYAGASTVLLPERVNAEVIFKTIEKYKPTIFFGVPTLYNSLIRYAQNSKSKYDLSSIRLCISSAEPLPVCIADRWKQMFNLPILDAIGSTETLHAFIANTVENSKEGSSGKLVPGYEARIVGQNGEDLPNYVMGNLLIKGDSIAAGYFNRHEATKSKFIGEWLVTGDKYFRDEEGYFFYCGRSDDLFKVRGMWVSPYEIESWLLKSEYVQEAAVVEDVDQSGFSKPRGFVVLKDNLEPNEKIKAELMKLVEDNLASFKHLQDITFLKELPKTATGKVQRYKLRNKGV